MKILDTTHKRKSATITALLLLLLLFGIFNFGMKYLDPPIEYGLAINLGNSEVGSGEPVEETQKQSSTEEVEEIVEEQQEVVEEIIEEVASEEVQEDIITDDSAEEAPVVEDKNVTEEVVETKPEKIVKETKPVEEKKVVKPTPKPKPKPKPSKATSDALNSLLNGSSNTGGTTGEGDDNEAGEKGNVNGDPNSNKYYGHSGTGSGGNYNLAGRKAISKPKQQPDCEEEGTVVVSIEVDNNGKVIKAVPGVKGSTNTAPCLLMPAKAAALSTKWNADDGAPVKQKGTIIYKFSLSK